MSRTSSTLLGFLILGLGLTSATAATPAQYVGVNLEGLNYYSTEWPFLNIFKEAGSGNGLAWQPWQTSSAGTSETNEEAYLQLDSDGYVTSLTAIPGSPGGQKFTYVQTAVIIGVPAAAPGASTPYPRGPYTLQFQGAGTIVLTGDPSALSSSTPGISISGTRITSSMAAGTTATVTFSVGNQANGIGFQITALPSQSNYIKAISIVQSAYQSLYARGELFSPVFEATLAGYSRLRMMAWGNTNYLDYGIDFSGPLPAGATSGTISSIATTSTPYSVWPFASGSYNFIFATGQVIPVTLTTGSSAATWSTPLSAAEGTSTRGAFYSRIETWSQRPLLSNASWAYKGVPVEAMVQLCNEVGADCWICIPGTAQAVQNYASGLAQLLFSGAGASLSGSPLASFHGLNAAHKAYIEYSNEYWNFGFEQAQLIAMMGTPLYPINKEWFGQQLAGIGDTFYSAYGATAFANQVVISMSQQASNPSDMVYAMNTPDWTSRAYTHHIGAIHTGGYFGLDSPNQMSSADVATLQSFTPAQQVQAYFDLAYSNVSNGHTFTSMQSGGYVPGIVNQITSDISSVSTQPWGKLPRNIYEGGTSNNYPGGGSGSAWQAMLASASRDARSQYIYYDPAHQLNSSSTGFLSSAAAGVAGTGVPTFSANIFQDVNQISGANWEVLESSLQAITPLSSAPPKYQGIMNYIGDSSGGGGGSSNSIPMAPTNLVVH